MNLDAILLFFNKFELLDYNDKDILLMSSAVLNKSIDINLSIKENFLKYKENNPSFNADKYLNRPVVNCDVPIYRLLLQEKELFTIIVDACKKGLVTSESFRDIIECFIDAIDKVMEEENGKLLTHIIALLSIKNNNLDKEVMNDSVIIREFVKNNLYALNMSKKKKNDCDTVSKKMIILKLFRLGFVRFGNVNNIELTYEDILQPLIDQFNYGQIKLVVYNDNVPFEDLDYVESYIHKAIDANYDRSSQEDRDYGEKGKADISLCFDLRRGSQELRKGNV